MKYTAFDVVPAPATPNRQQKPALPGIAAFSEKVKFDDVVVDPQAPPNDHELPEQLEPAMTPPTAHELAAPENADAGPA